MPILRPFRALRFDPSSVGDLAAVVAPPYDVIGPAERVRLIARHPANVVRLDLPAEESGDSPDDRYRRAARTLAAWRSDGTLRKDPHPSIYVYEQTYRVPGTDTERTQRGYFARLRLEPFGADGGILRHERTLSGPREDRYKLLRATGVNTSPVIGLFEDRSGSTAERLRAIVAGPPEVDLADVDGVRHRLWPLTADGDGPTAAMAASILAAGAASPITIALGPIASFNVLSFLAPAGAAWAAYFLTRHLTASLLPSLVAGFLFGFSSYELNVLAAGVLDLSLVLLLPLIAYLVVRHLEGSMGSVAFAVWLGLALAAQFLIFASS